MRCFLYKLRIFVLFLWKELRNGMIAEFPYGKKVVAPTGLLMVGEVLFIESLGYRSHSQCLIMCLIEA